MHVFQILIVIWYDTAKRPDTKSTQDHVIGKQWRIDCRNNASNSVLLLQRASNNSNWQERQPNGVDVTERQQVFTIYSLNEADIGYYYCKVCNETKYIGKISSGK